MNFQVTDENETKQSFKSENSENEAKEELEKINEFILSGRKNLFWIGGNIMANAINICLIEINGEPKKIIRSYKTFDGDLFVETVEGEKYIYKKRIFSMNEKWQKIESCEEKKASEK